MLPGNHSAMKQFSPYHVLLQLCVASCRMCVSRLGLEKEGIELLSYRTSLALERGPQQLLEQGSATEQFTGKVSDPVFALSGI